MTKLPPPAGTMTVTYGIDQKVKVPVYDEKQVREYVAAAVAAEREACAELVETFAIDMDDEWVCAKAAEAIRARGQA